MCIAQTKHDNRTLNKVRAILFQNDINYTSLPYDRVVIAELYTNYEFKLMQRLLPESGNSAIGRCLTHKVPYMPKFRPDGVVGAYRVILQIK